MNATDKEIAGKIAGAYGLRINKLGLRFDKVAIRLLTGCRDALFNHIPGNTVVLVTITAPILLPAKTGTELIRQIKTLLQGTAYHTNNNLVIFQNKILVRIIRVPGKQDIAMTGFVHNPGSNAVELLDMASKWFAGI